MVFAPSKGLSACLLDQRSDADDRCRERLHTHLTLHRETLGSRRGDRLHGPIWARREMDPAARPELT